MFPHFQRRFKKWLLRQKWDCLEVVWTRKLSEKRKDLTYGEELHLTSLSPKDICNIYISCTDKTCHLIQYERITKHVPSVQSMFESVTYVL